MDEVTTDLSEELGRKSVDDVSGSSRSSEDVLGQGDLVVEGGGRGERGRGEEGGADDWRKLLEDIKETRLLLER